MNRINIAFDTCRSRNECVFIPYITAGDPDRATTEQMLRCLVDNGADIIELGVPFSDPMADGPTIQAASQRALRNDFSMESVLDLVAGVRRYSQVPVILFGYYNPVFRYGLENLCRDAAAAGVDGLLTVDLPPEEAGDLKRAADASGLAMIYLIAPTSTEERLALIARQASGFVYFVSVTGVTGARRDLDQGLQDYVSAVRQHTDLPVGIGFGVSTPAHVRTIATFADAVIVGSAIIRVAEDHLGQPDMIERIGSFVKDLKEATRRT